MIIPFHVPGAHGLYLSGATGAVRQAGANGIPGSKDVP